MSHKFEPRGRYGKRFVPRNLDAHRVQLKDRVGNRWGDPKQPVHQRLGWLTAVGARVNSRPVQLERSLRRKGRKVTVGVCGGRGDAVRWCSEMVLGGDAGRGCREGMLMARAGGRGVCIAEPPKICAWSMVPERSGRGRL